ncbi:MAG TPA: hypothetical protein PLN21_14265 [Gemmatales bacterium]|nr:hypothetical protein [Gemmatales bacterium]
MNIWSRILLHLRRARLRQRFAKQQEILRAEFRSHLLAGTSQDRRWHDVEWLTEPILHVLPDTDEIPVALVGIAAMYSLEESNEVQTQAGTALFYFKDNAWQSNGKVLLNLTSSEALNQLSLKAMT